MTIIPFLVLMAVSPADCQVRLHRALETTLGHVEVPNGVHSILPIYRPPEVRLREEADRIERLRREVEEARKALKECAP